MPGARARLHPPATAMGLQGPQALRSVPADRLRVAPDSLIEPALAGRRADPRGRVWVFAIWAIWGVRRRIWRWALVGIRMDRRKAGDLRFTMKLITPNNGEQFLIERENATLNNLKVFSPATPT